MTMVQACDRARKGARQLLLGELSLAPSGLPTLLKHRNFMEVLHGGMEVIDGG